MLIWLLWIPGLAWYTSGQYTWSRGFYARYRQDSTSPYGSASSRRPGL